MSEREHAGEGDQMQSRRFDHDRGSSPIVILVALVTIVLAAPTASLAKHRVTVMTRNLYLGADLSPAINATSTNDFIRKNGQILRDVDTNDFPVRARGLANEILAKDPDLVGLQEVALWRTGPVNDLAPITHDLTATTVTHDCLQLLLAALNQGRERYRVVAVQTELDFEAPADYDGVAGDGDLPGLNDDGELNGRLTMPDVILARTGGNVKTANATGGHYQTLYTPVISGIPVTVERGWTQADARVRGSGWFRFVNTHLEAFGDPTIREAQAEELVAPGGAATGDLPVILVGDLNSDDDTVQGGDRLAYQALTDAGFGERSTDDPLSCCLDTSILIDDFGSVSDFDHQVDHVLTNESNVELPELVGGAGRQPVNGYWDSDHAGLFSALRVPWLRPAASRRREAGSATAAKLRPRRVGARPERASSSRAGDRGRTGDLVLGKHTL